MRRTCAGCEHLTENLMPNRMGFFMSCGKSEMVVPHRSAISDDGKSFEMTFWRVPLECPLPDDEVLKSENRAPQKYWGYASVPV